MGLVKSISPHWRIQQGPRLGNNRLITLEDIFWLHLWPALPRENWCTRTAYLLRHTIWCFEICGHLWNLITRKKRSISPNSFPVSNSNPSFLPRRHLSITHSNQSISVKISTVLNTKQRIRTCLLAYKGGVQNTCMLAMPVCNHPRSVPVQMLSFDEHIRLSDHRWLDKQRKGRTPKAACGLGWNDSSA